MPEAWAYLDIVEATNQRLPLLAQPTSDKDQRSIARNQIAKEWVAAVSKRGM